MIYNSEQGLENEFSDDSMFDGELICRQHKNGYRFSIDAVLAAHFHIPKKGERILDLGCGCGIIGLLMMFRWPETIDFVSSLEIQPSLKKLADHNYAANGYADRCTCQLGDTRNILEYFEPESFSHVVCNPPFYQITQGRQNVDSESRVARHQVAGDLDDFVRAAAAVVKNRGSAVFVYPADMFLDLSNALNHVRLIIKKIQFIYSYPNSTKEAKLVVVECKKNGGKGVKILPPFYIYSERKGSYSQEMQILYNQLSKFR